MSNALFLSSRHADGATVVGSSELSALPAANVQKLRPDKVWRATGCTAEYLTIDFGSAVAADALALVAHNLTESATLRMRGASTAANVTAAPAVDTTAVSAWPASGKPTDPDWPYYFSLLTWSNAVAYRYWRLDIADSTNPAGYVQAGRLFAGPNFVPATNVDINVGIGLSSPGLVARSSFGKVFADDRGAPARAFVLPMSSITETELTDSIFELQRYCGLARDFAFCLDPSATTRFHKYSSQVMFASLNVAQAQPLWDSGNVQLWQTSLTLNEVV